MYLAISYPSSSFKEYVEFRKNNNPLLKTGVYGSNKKFKNPNPRGGLIRIIDWESKELVWQHNFFTPGGFFFDKKILYLLEELGDKVIGVNSGGKVETKFSHPLLNYPHTLTPTPNGVLISSTALDAIVELDFKGNKLFDWIATEQGYSITPRGDTRIIDRAIDHRGIKYPTLSQTTHVNSAIQVGDNSILATLFHQGQLIHIDKKTKEHKVLIDGLNHPHAINQDYAGGVYYV